MVRVSELRLRDVVNLKDGRRLGVIKDMDLDVEEGKVRAIILPGATRLLGLARGEEMAIPWERVKTLGVDVILVEVEETFEPRKRA